VAPLNDAGLDSSPAMPTAACSLYGPVGPRGSRRDVLEERPRLGERFGAVRIFTAAEIMADELPPVPWVVPDTLPHRCKTFRTALARLANQGALRKSR
jgi:hypothetical protein